MVNENPPIADVARMYANALPQGQHAQVQEAIRFARWLGEDRRIADIRPPDIESYVETFGMNAPNASARADSLKAFLAFAHKQKLMPERLVSHVRVRKAAGSRAKAGSSVVQESNELQLTSEGIKALETELETLKGQRPKIAEELRLAMADKDFRENAPLDAARDAQGQLEGRIRELEATLKHAVVLAGQSANDVARVGTNVTLVNISTGTKMSYLLVNPAEVRSSTGRLSVESPVGKAVVGRRAGDEVEVEAPSGKIRFRVESVEAS